MNRVPYGSIVRRQTLSELLRTIGMECDDSRRITQVSDRSEEIGENGLFVALRGEHADGNDFAAQVKSRGGIVLSDCPQTADWLCPDPRAAYPHLLQAYYGYPAQRLTMIGITGTNGKSTVAWLLATMLKSMGIRCLLIGTGRIWFDGQQQSSPNTTPDPLTLTRLLARAVQEGIEVVVMEVSSQALALHRVDGITFDLAVLTQLRQDHLDFHQTLAQYQQAKFQLFTRLKEKGTAILNADDPICERWLPWLRHPVMTYGRRSLNFQLQPLAVSAQRIVMRINQHRIEAPLAGGYNMENLAAALACGFMLDLNWQKMVDFAATATLPPGRMQIVCRTPLLCVVDYAHTVSALKALLSHWRSEADRRGCRLWVIFGCGGQREKQKRPAMGQVACALADEVILSEDNSRAEKTDEILAQIAQGCDGRQKMIPCRSQAVKFAVNEAATDDIIIVAGKGEETFRIEKTTQNCLSDADLIRQALKQRGG